MFSSNFWLVGRYSSVDQIAPPANVHGPKIHNVLNGMPFTWHPNNLKAIWRYQLFVTKISKNSLDAQKFLQHFSLETQLLFAERCLSKTLFLECHSLTSHIYGMREDFSFLRNVCVQSV